VIDGSNHFSLECVRERVTANVKTRLELLDQKLSSGVFSLTALMAEPD
jgi:hypothetical protein